MDEDLRLFGPSSRLLLALTQASEHACCGVIHQTLPLLEDMYNKFTGVSTESSVSQYGHIVSTDNTFIIHTPTLYCRKESLNCNISLFSTAMLT